MSEDKNTFDPLADGSSEGGYSIDDFADTNIENTIDETPEANNDSEPEVENKGSENTNVFLDQVKELLDSNELNEQDTVVDLFNGVNDALSALDDGSNTDTLKQVSMKLTSAISNTLKQRDGQIKQLKQGSLKQSPVYKGIQAIKKYSPSISDQAALEILNNMYHFNLDQGRKSKNKGGAIHPIVQKNANVFETDAKSINEFIKSSYNQNNDSFVMEDI